MKNFTVTGCCSPKENYMVDITNRLDNMCELVERQQYFVINRARQYGKTTTLNLLAERLQDDYAVFFLSFEGIGESDYQTENAFCKMLCALMLEELEIGNAKYIDEDTIAQLDNIVNHDATINFRTLGSFFSQMCREAKKKVVLIIDEVDQLSGSLQFIDFLGVLRKYYLKRSRQATFQSVILAGVYDIVNLKARIRDEKEERLNSPWNIAVAFEENMNFSVEDIKGMLNDYESDIRTGMNVSEMAGLLYDYTEGYPFMVSRLCKIMDEVLVAQGICSSVSEGWTRQGFLEAVKILLEEENTLFDSMNHKLDQYKELADMLYSLLFTGKDIVYTSGVQFLDLALRFGFVKKAGSSVVIANRIFEVRLYNRFLAQGQMQEQLYDASLTDRNQFIENGYLNMELVLQKFTEHFTDLYSDNDVRFVEENGRRLFLLYIRPIINGTGNYYIEAQTRDKKRTDVIIDYLGKQYIIELKIWHGQEYTSRGEQQLAEYLDYYHLTIGYMLSFNFNKKKEVGVKKIEISGKTLIEAVV